MEIKDTIKEFPDVKFYNTNSRLNNKSLISEFSFSPDSINWSVDALYAICSGIQNTERFIGTNAESYAESIRGSNLLNMESAPYEMEPSITSEQFLDTIIREFAPKYLAYAVIEREGMPDKVECIIKEQGIMREFLRGEYRDYDPRRVERTIIVPSEKLTEIVWGFTYDMKDLERMVSYR